MYVCMFPGLLALVGTSWYGHRIAKEFYDPFTPTNSRCVSFFHLVCIHHNHQYSCV